MTFGQLEVLYNHAVEEVFEEWEFHAKLHGADIRGKDKKKSGVMNKYENCVVGDPETYKHLTAEERQEWTEILMGIHKESMVI